MRARKVFLLVLGSLVALATLGLVIGGTVAVWANATQRHADGYYQSSADRYATTGYALVSTPIDIGNIDSLPGGIGTLRVSANPLNEGASGVFVGVARQADIDRYLSGVPYDEVSEPPFGPLTLHYRQHNGTGRTAPARPGTQTFWLASAAGRGAQTVTWKITEGTSAVVVMNADASSGVAVAASAGINTGLVLAAGLVAFGAALVFAAATVGLLYAGLRGEPAVEPRPVAVGSPVPGTYPARLDGHPDLSLSRGLWLVKWFLAIPHFIVLVFLWMAFFVLTVLAFFAILFTGRYPRRIFDFNVGVIRWTWRVTFYAFVLGTDRYPPFSLAPDPSYPATFDVDYPQRLSRGLVLVKWWLLALPQYIIVGIFGGAAAWWGASFTWGTQGVRFAGFGLIGILALVAGVTLLFRRRYPESVFEFMMGMERWTYRVCAYATLMRDEYPPFRLDNGGSDPGTLPLTPPLPFGPPEQVDTDTTSR